MQQLLDRREALYALVQSVGSRMVEIERAITAHYAVHIPGQHIVVGKVTRTTYVVVGVSYADTSPWYVLWCRKQVDRNSYSEEIYMLSRPDKYVGVDSKDSKDTTDRILLRYKDLKKFQKGVSFPSVYKNPPLPSQQINAGGRCFMYAGSDNNLVQYQGEGGVFPKINPAMVDSKLYEPSIVDDWIIQRIMPKRKKRRIVEAVEVLPEINEKAAFADTTNSISNVINGVTGITQDSVFHIKKKRGRPKGKKNTKSGRGFIRPSCLDKRENENSELL